MIGPWTYVILIFDFYIDSQLRIFLESFELLKNARTIQTLGRDYYVVVGKQYLYRILWNYNLVFI